MPLPVALTATALYVRAANPSVGGGNSGEFQVMAHLLGIAHAPSYPLYLLLAKAASLLPLPGDVAWRINVFTAAVGGAAVYLAGLLALLLWPRVPAGALAATIAATAVAAMPRLWSLAVEAEVFTLHLLLVLATWAALIRWRSLVRPGGAAPLRPRHERAAARWLVSIALLCGLGLSNHRTFLFVAAGVVLCIAATHPLILRRPRLLAAGAAGLILGLSPYLYILRGLVVPVAYFSPTAVHRLSRGEVWYVLQGNATGETGGGEVIVRLFADPPFLMARLAWLWQHLAGQFGLAGHALAYLGIIGLALVARRHPLWTLAACGGAGGAAVFAMAYAKYPDPDRYLLPLQALLAIGLGQMVASAASHGQRLGAPYPHLGRLAGAGAGLLLAAYWALPLGTLSATTRFTRGGYVHHTIHNLIAVEPHAVVCTWWVSAWGWWYAQFVDGYRPDVLLVAKGPDDCARDVVPVEFGRRPVYLPALTDAVRRSPYVYFPSRDLWLAVAPREPLAPGLLLKGPDERIYLYEDGQRRWVPTLAAFTAHGFSWDLVRLTPDYVLREIPEGPPLLQYR